VRLILAVLDPVRFQCSVSHAVLRPWVIAAYQVRSNVPIQPELT